MDARKVRSRQQAHRTTTARAVPRERLTPLEIIALLILASALVYAALSAPGEGTRAAFDTVTIRIEPSDTLWSVAASRRVDGLDTQSTVRIIQELNGMSGATIAAGQLLVVPNAPDASTALALLD